LPAILINGHEWVFAATQQDDPLGYPLPLDRQEMILVCTRFVRVIQELAVWSKDSYWPWYKENVLGMPVVNTVGGVMEKEP